MPGFGSEHWNYTDNRTLPYNQRLAQFTQTSSYEGSGVVDPAFDFPSVPPEDPNMGYVLTGYEPGMALMVANRGRQPSAFRTAPGPGSGNFTPAGG